MSIQSSFVIFDLTYDVPEMTVSLSAKVYLLIVSHARRIFSSMNRSISSFRMSFAWDSVMSGGK